MTYERPTPEYAIELLQYIPQRPDYWTWLHCISAIGNSFDEQTAKSIIYTRFQDFKPNETQNKINARLRQYNFGTLVYYAKQNGYRHERRNSLSKLSYQPLALPTSPKEPKKELVKFGEPPNLLYTYPINSELPEFLQDIIESDIADGKTPEQARQDVLKREPYWLKSERVYSLAINKQVLNKNLNPQTLKPYEYYDFKMQEMRPTFTALNSYNQNVALTINELCDVIGSGYALCCSQLTEKADGTTYKVISNFKQSELVFIDVDNAEIDPITKEKRRITDGYMTIDDCLQKPATRKAMLLYTSVNHTDTWHRYRLIFPLPRTIPDPKVYKQIVEHYVSLYNSDETTSVVNSFYGNSNATIYNLIDGTISTYTDGVKIND